MNINELESLVSNYQQAQPEAMQGMEPVLQAERRTLAESFLNAPEHEVRPWYDGPEGKQFHILRGAGLQNLPRDAQGELLSARILQKWESEKTPGTLIAAMIMLQPREFPLPAHLTDITDWLRKDYADFLLMPIGVFNRIGEAEQFASFFAAVVDMFHRALVSDKTFPGAEEIHNLFVHRANFIQIYFNEKNLRKTYRQRAEIMESWALKQNAPLAHVFPLRRGNRQTGGASQFPVSKIKVGILSAHFTPQTEIYLMLSYFDKMPRELCHVTLYSMRQTDHPLETYCRGRVDNFVLLPESGAYPQKVDRIRADDLDILLIGTNTSAVTNPITIMALFRMARTHVIVENSPVSTGFTHTDYYLSSMFNEPDEDAQDHYTEHLYRVPGMLNYYAYHFDKDPRTVTLTRAQLNIPEDAVIYFSGANFFKILPDLSNVWAWIFSQVRNSYLILMPFNPNWTSRYLSMPFINRVRAQMESLGVDFVNRVRILNRVPTRADVHGIMELCDVYLDSFPYAGACSMIDPLTVGLPIVCRDGKTMRGSLAAAMLRGAGLEDMIVEDAGEYVERAVALGRDPELREHVRDHIQETLSCYTPFFDTAACGVKTAAAFKDMVDCRHRREVRLLRQKPDDLRAVIENLSACLIRNNNLYFQNLVDAERVRLFLVPYFQSLPADNRRPHLMDVGAGSGQFAVPFLNMGWSADLFEPNPAYHAQLNSLAQQAPEQVKLETGNWKLESGKRLDMVRICVAEEGAIDMLAKDEFNGLSPRIMLIETETAIGPDHPILNSYDSLVLRYAVDAHSGRRKLAGMTFGQANDADSKSIIFFPKNDTIFLVTLVRLLESFLPANDK